MNALRLAWPGIALAVTFVDDFVAGPLLAATGAWLGGQAGVLAGVLLFTGLVGVLILSVVLASRTLDPEIRAKVDHAVDKASRRRYIGKHVRRVGDEHPWSTALVAAVISPVLAVILARLIHPSQRLIRTAVVAAIAYGVGFAVFYTSLGAGAAGLV